MLDGERVQETRNAHLQEVMVHLKVCSSGHSQMEQDGSDYHAWSLSDVEEDRMVEVDPRVRKYHPLCSQTMADLLAVNNDLASRSKRSWHWTTGSFLAVNNGRIIVKRSLKGDSLGLPASTYVAGVVASSTIK